MTNEHMLQIFADQFQVEGGQILYRKSLKGAPIAVSAQERDRLIAAFRRDTRWLTAALVGGLVLAAFCIIVWDLDRSGSLSTLDITLALVAPCIGFFAYFLWVWNAPMRLLAGRTPVGPAPTREEVRRLAFARLGWGQLSAVAVGGAFSLLHVDWRLDLWRGSNLMWLALAVAMLLAAGVQALRKWRRSLND